MSTHAPGTISAIHPSFDYYRAAGFRIALDDGGSGYSSLTTSLGIDALAEGIETPGELA